MSDYGITYIAKTGMLKTGDGRWAVYRNAHLVGVYRWKWVARVRLMMSHG